jgi:tetratricopeptide (TPR) repeat protein
VNAQNANREGLDVAIASFESIVDPANQPKDENLKPKFDFTRDYVVLAELGRTLYKRSELEPPRSESERSYLLRAVDACERALDVDPEDLDAHYWLNQCYHRLGRGAPLAADLREPVTVERLADLGNAVVKKETQPEERVKAAADLAAGVTALGKLPPDPKHPRLPTVRALLNQLRPAFHEEQEPTVQAAIGAVLAELHLLSHTLYKPDELAHSRATQKYRDSHPAANAAAEAIVVYPTNRPGAPR